MSRLKGPSHELHQNLRAGGETVLRVVNSMLQTAAHDLERRDALGRARYCSSARRDASGQEFRIARHIVHQREHLRGRCSDDGAAIDDLQMGDSAGDLARQGGILAHRTVDSRAWQKPPIAAPPPIAVNRKARFDYFIEERFEAGLSLLGWEVKSMRAGKAQIAEAYVYLKNGEAFLFGAHIAPLNSASTHVDTDPTRTRKLLLEPPAARSSARRRRAPRLYPGAPAALLEGGPRQARARACQGQEAARQARHRQGSRLAARQEPHHEGEPALTGRRLPGPERTAKGVYSASLGADRFRHGLRNFRCVPRC